MPSAPLFRHDERVGALGQVQQLRMAGIGGLCWKVGQRKWQALFDRYRTWSRSN